MDSTYAHKTQRKGLTFKSNPCLSGSWPQSSFNNHRQNQGLSLLFPVSVPDVAHSQ